MEGWKTKTGAGLAMAWGVAGFLLGQHDLNQAIMLIAGGLTAWGAGHKLDKLKQTISATPKA